MQWKYLYPLIPLFPNDYTYQSTTQLLMQIPTLNLCPKYSQLSILMPIPITSLSLAIICLYLLKIDLTQNRSYKMWYKNGQHDMDLPLLNVVLSNIIKAGWRKVVWYCDRKGEAPEILRYNGGQPHKRCTSSRCAGCEFSINAVQVGDHWEVRHRPESRFHYHRPRPEAGQCDQ